MKAKIEVIDTVFAVAMSIYVLLSFQGAISAEVPGVAGREGADETDLVRGYVAYRDQCGPVAAYLALRHGGLSADLDKLAQDLGASKEGTSLAALARVLSSRGIGAEPVHMTPEALRRMRSPFIATMRGLDGQHNHFVYVPKIDDANIWAIDSAGLRKWNLDEFVFQWQGSGIVFNSGVAQSQDARFPWTRAVLTLVVLLECGLLTFFLFRSSGRPRRAHQH